VTHDFLKTLRLCAPCNKYERYGEPNDGGYVMCSDGLEKGLVGAFSYGINGFDGWGMAIASQYHIPLHEFDCTNLKQPDVCHGCDVHFHAQCLLNHNGDAKAASQDFEASQPEGVGDSLKFGDERSNNQEKFAFKTLTQMFKESGQANAKDRSLLLKIDVEAAEWKIFAEEPVKNLKKFREIVVEYHWLHEVENHKLYLEAVRKIEKAGFSVSHMHGNNYGGGMQEFGKYSIPDVIEVAYIQTPKDGCAANIPYNIPELDMPNAKESPEMPDAVLPTKL
jgi:hypothetical protein